LGHVGEGDSDMNEVMRVEGDDEPRASQAVPRAPSLGPALSPGRHDPVPPGSNVLGLRSISTLAIGLENDLPTMTFALLYPTRPDLYSPLVHNPRPLLKLFTISDHTLSHYRSRPPAAHLQ
jgi:hypothetical protein